MAELKIEAGRYYKAMCGDKLYCLGKSPFGPGRFVFVREDGELMSRGADGKVVPEKEHRGDLIDEWHDPVKKMAYLHRYKDTANVIISETPKFADWTLIAKHEIVEGEGMDAG